MPNAWFRLYAEFADDPKVQILSEAYQRRLIMLFCLKCKGQLETLHETQIAFHLRITPEELAVTKAVFVENGFIDERWNVENWNKRQYLSDSSTERVRRYRQSKKQDETLHETDETQSVTAPDTDTDTEQKHKKLKTLARSVPDEELAGTLPLADGTLYRVSKSQVEDWRQAFPGVDVKQELKRMKAWLDANPTRKKTGRGICRAVVSWLSRAQDQGRPGTPATPGVIRLADMIFTNGAEQ